MDWGDMYGFIFFNCEHFLFVYIVKQNKNKNFADFR